VCPSGQTFFGLTSEYINNIYEQIYMMVMRTNFTFSELYSFTVSLRNWFVERTIKHFEKEAKR
jgi:hypothetical protein